MFSMRQDTCGMRGVVIFGKYSVVVRTGHGWQILVNYTGQRKQILTTSRKVNWLCNLISQTFDNIYCYLET